MNGEGSEIGSAHPCEEDGRHVYASVCGPPDLGAGPSAARSVRSAVTEGPRDRPKSPQAGRAGGRRCWP